MPIENHKGYELNRPQNADSTKGWREVRNFKKLIDTDENLQRRIDTEAQARANEDARIEAQISSHTADNGRHLNAGEREYWNGKQDKLTAGQNISISPANVISAVDTVYDDSNIRGLIATETTARISGDNTLQQNITNVINTQNTVNSDLQAQINTKWDEIGGKNWVVEILNQIESGFFNFRGIVSSVPPNNNDYHDSLYSNGTLWCVKGIQGGMPDLVPGEFWECYEIQNGVWSYPDTTKTYGIGDGVNNPEIAEQIGDLWFNDNDGYAYYRLRYSWKQFGADIDLSDIWKAIEERAQNRGNIAAGSGSDTSTAAQANTTVWGMLQNIWNRIRALAVRADALSSKGIVLYIELTDRERYNIRLTGVDPRRLRKRMRWYGHPSESEDDIPSDDEIRNATTVLIVESSIPYNRVT